MAQTSQSPAANGARQAYSTTSENPANSLTAFPSQRRRARRPGRVWSRKDLNWQGNVLRAGRVELAEIEPDDLWPGLWRVITPSGVSDLVNLSRARDAAVALSLAALNKSHNQETALEAPPVRPFQRAVS